MREKTVKDYMLHQSYNNPFDPSTTICYRIPQCNYVKLIVFDMFGNVIKTLVNEYKTQGKYSVHFDAYSLANGVYFYHLHAGNYISTKK